MFFRTKSNGRRTYLQLVENKRSGSRVRQQVIATLGRLDKLQASGALDRLLSSGARLSEYAAILSAHDQARQAHPERTTARVIGPALVFERLWRLTGCRQALRQSLSRRRFQFDVERAVFLTVLHRLCAPGSDRSALRWAADQAISGIGALQLHHLYRAMAWLGEPLPKPPDTEADPPAAAESAAQAAPEGEADDDGEPPAPRCVKDELEEALFARRRDLFTTFDLVFFDTTSHSFHGAGGETLGRRGKSKDFRPQCKPVILGLTVDSTGRPLGTEIWPGNPADVTALLPVADRLRERFAMPELCVVADRGMISRQTMETLEGRGWGSVLGVRIRNVKEFREQVLGAAKDPAKPVEKADGIELRLPRLGAKEPLELSVQEVIVRDRDADGEPTGAARRYVVCRNTEQARRDKAVREATVEKLRARLSKGPKALVGNRGFQRYLEAKGKGFAVDEGKIAAEERYDGVWALRVKGPLTAEEAAVKYKQLWQVERRFREAKSLLKTRPVYHQTDAAIRGHLFCSFLALVLRQELRQRMEAAGIEAEWADVMRDLVRLQETVLDLQGKRFAVRTQARGAVGRIASCVGARLPPVVRREAGGDAENEPSEGAQ